MTATTQTPVRNKRLIYAIARRIEKQPKRYKQAVWGEAPNMIHPCGTAHCIAGHALSICGCKFTYNSRGEIERLLRPSGREVYNSNVTGRGTHLGQYAADRLGLTYAERKVLFDGSWIPRDGLSVPDALRRFADGAHLRDVTAPSPYSGICAYYGVEP